MGSRSWFEIYYMDTGPDPGDSGMSSLSTNLCRFSPRLPCNCKLSKRWPSWVQGEASQAPMAHLLLKTGSDNA